MSNAEKQIVRTERGIALVMRVEVDEHGLEYYHLFFGDSQSGYCYKRGGNHPGWGVALAEDATLFKSKLSHETQKRLGLKEV